MWYSSSIFICSVNQKQAPEVFYKEAFLKNFAIFTGKHQCWSLFLIKLQAFLREHLQCVWHPEKSLHNWSLSNPAIPPSPHSSLFFGLQNLTRYCWITSFPALNPSQHFFYLVFGCPTANFGSLSRGKPISSNVDHNVVSVFDRRVTSNRAARLGP